MICWGLTVGLCWGLHPSAVPRRRVRRQAAVFTRWLCNVEGGIDGARGEPVTVSASEATPGQARTPAVFAKNAGCVSH
jgi:hypothetical protein